MSIALVAILFFYSFNIRLIDMNLVLINSVGQETINVDSLYIDINMFFIKLNNPTSDTKHTLKQYLINNNIDYKLDDHKRFIIATLDPTAVNIRIHSDTIQIITIANKIVTKFLDDITEYIEAIAKYTSLINKIKDTKDLSIVEQSVNTKIINIHSDIYGLCDDIIDLIQDSFDIPDDTLNIINSLSANDLDLSAINSEYLEKLIKACEFFNEFDDDDVKSGIKDALNKLNDIICNDVKIGK